MDSANEGVIGGREPQARVSTLLYGACARHGGAGLETRRQSKCSRPTYRCGLFECDQAVAWIVQYRNVYCTHYNTLVVGRRRICSGWASETRG